MSKKRTTYTAAFKAKVALAAQFKVHPLVISKWESQLLNNAESLFQDGRIKKGSLSVSMGER